MEDEVFIGGVNEMALGKYKMKSASKAVGRRLTAFTEDMSQGESPWRSIAN
jgi:hypothetical protein